MYQTSSINPVYGQISAVLTHYTGKHAGKMLRYLNKAQRTSTGCPGTVFVQANETFHVSGLMVLISDLAAQAYSAHIALQMKLLAGAEHPSAGTQECVLKWSSW